MIAIIDCVATLSVAFGFKRKVIRKIRKVMMSHAVNIYTHDSGRME